MQLLLLNPILLALSTTLPLFLIDKEESEKLDKNEKEIFYEVTGLNAINDRVLEAAYKVYQYMTREPAIKKGRREIRSDVKIDIEELFSDEDRESLMLISNLSKGIKKFGFNTHFNVRELANAIEITPTIAKKWLNEAVNRGLVTTETDKDGGVIYSFNREAFTYFIDNLERSINAIKHKISGEEATELEEAIETISGIGETKMGEKLEIEEEASDKEELKTQILDIVGKMEEILREKVKNIKGEGEEVFIKRVKSLKKELGRELVFEILDCRRLKRVVQIEGGEVSKEQVDKCSKVLQSLKEGLNPNEPK